MKQRKGGKNYELDMSWSKKQLLAGNRVFCLRAKDTGLVVLLLAADNNLWWKGFEWDTFTLTEITMLDGEPKWGYEMPGPTAEMVGSDG